MKVKNLILLVLTTMSVNLAAQDFAKLSVAFTESYAKEKEGKYADAAKPLKAMYDEKSYEVNLRLGWLTYLQGQFSESVGYYSKAIELMPYAIEPRLGIVLPASAMGNWGSVVEQYNKILSIDPNNTLVLYRMGMISYENKDFKKAYTYFEKVVNLYPFDYYSVLMLGWTNYQLGKTKEAKILFQKALLYDPTSASAKEGLSLLK
ncbi:tetratricopeptide repeat protein [Tenuifilum sp.]|uniref:tetratricopeptide repeat protein n=1 Tax=Tenuifilum sp. TaxID=2760880 RepID=UPI001B632D6C|nr:tetratricopeptide repeat protein [Bacteroidales bacterium]HOK61786.1 tetratricopeptide repeat protein [Tenuifilum sp.]MBP9029046.1 tetratricopeptide repeat protein [Bacteroidales bacterium]HOK86435.1 tetratricopeptide repeat protein [Tenuifilum sp.]HON69879.1 tetratricopeptide repeat protein [Tenuifilum sp.]